MDKPATGPFVKMSKSAPEPGKNYLILADYGGMKAFDVAFYSGRRPNGDHWWTLADISIDHCDIVAWAEINDSENDEAQ